MSTELQIWNKWGQHNFVGPAYKLWYRYEITNLHRIQMNLLEDLLYKYPYMSELPELKWQNS